MLGPFTTTSQLVAVAHEEVDTQYILSPEFKSMRAVALNVYVLIELLVN